MDQALSPPDLPDNILNTKHQRRCLAAKEENVAVTRASTNGPIRLTIINFGATDKLLKQYMFAEYVLKPIPLN